MSEIVWKCIRCEQRLSIGGGGKPVDCGECGLCPDCCGCPKPANEMRPHDMEADNALMCGLCAYGCCGLECPDVRNTVPATRAEMDAVAATLVPWPHLSNRPGVAADLTLDSLKQALKTFAADLARQREPLRLADAWTYGNLCRQDLVMQQIPVGDPDEEEEERTGWKEGEEHRGDGGWSVRKVNGLLHVSITWSEHEED